MRNHALASNHVFAPCWAVQKPRKSRHVTTAGSARIESSVWGIGFQCNERYLQWDGSAQAHLLKLHCAEKLGWEMAKVNEEMQDLADLLPGLAFRLDRIKASLLMRLLQNKAQVGDALLALKAEFPDADIEAMVSRYPSMLLAFSASELADRASALRSALPDVDNIDEVVEMEPRLLEVDVGAVLREVQRLLPGKNPQDFLSQQPSRVLDMSSQGLRPSIEDEPGIQALKHHSKG
eukprot:TRINITY_DN2904_c1_g1_i1.p1 TRINITY_DN2904_c1_g1~~TRINITY_DN2904_c1_g1_i1.p1  ORF type:complete len:235 (-),score=30.57 TRINITY_DN2904_c1_g1_i1:301-1005(-)